MTETISRYLTDGHRRCDRLLAACETAITATDWSVVYEKTAPYREPMLHHFELEERVLFPELELASPAARAPESGCWMHSSGLPKVTAYVCSSVASPFPSIDSYVNWATGGKRPRREGASRF